MQRQTIRFIGADGVAIEADAVGPSRAPAALLLHGGGQTRGSWRDSLDVLAERGFHAIAPDARGHGESGRSPESIYSIDGFSQDLHRIIAQIDTPVPPVAPVLIGASLGGITSLLTAGEGGPQVARALVLVDVAVTTNPYGVQQIHQFMRANPDGFASIDDAAEAVAVYATDRPRPKSNAGLERNLRLRNGRWFWHWDPAFLDTFHVSQVAARDRMRAAARALRIPVLLIHAARSNVVTEDQVAELRELVPQVEYERIEGAGHMVVGDRNSSFNQAIVSFLDRHGLPGPH